MFCRQDTEGFTFGVQFLSMLPVGKRSALIIGQISKQYSTIPILRKNIFNISINFDISHFIITNI